MLKLTARQQEVLDLITTSIAERSMPPTRSEIAAAMGFRSTNASEDHLRALERKGAIEILSGTSRGIRVLVDPKNPATTAAASAANDDFTYPELPAANSLPVLGQVAAGSPLLAAENIDFHLDINPHSFSRKADYLLKVKGLSMIDAGILEGDLLAVHRTQEEPKNGQLVVARIGDEVTVKEFQRQGHLIQLLAANPDFAPIEVDLRNQEFTIEGLAVGLVRNNLSS